MTTTEYASGVRDPEPLHIKVSPARRRVNPVRAQAFRSSSQTSNTIPGMHTIFGHTP